MCNACGFYCCASDVFGGCGCEHCPCPECWPDEPDEEYEEYEDVAEELHERDRAPRP